jgi:hypothetical protein
MYSSTVAPCSHEKSEHRRILDWIHSGTGSASLRQPDKRSSMNRNNKEKDFINIALGTKYQRPKLASYCYPVPNIAPNGHGFLPAVEIRKTYGRPQLIQFYLWAKLAPTCRGPTRCRACPDESRGWQKADVSGSGFSR